MSRLNRGLRSHLHMDRDHRHQEDAVLDARLAKLRDSLNAWWIVSEGGQAIANRLFVLQRLDEAVEQMARIKRLRRK
jgi:hypothetical protein